MTVSPMVTHRCPNLYANPDVFDPDNFSVENVAKRHKYSYIAFSGGPRGCIGRSGDAWLGGWARAPALDSGTRDADRHTGSSADRVRSRVRTGPDPTSVEDEKKHLRARLEGRVERGRGRG